jgi:hypothetical protein
MGQKGQAEPMDEMGRMDHGQAVEQMAAERYLLNELTLEQRDAFEEHVFDCHNCALDLRAAAAFMEEAKVQLPALVAAATPPAVDAVKRRSKWEGWFSFARPAFAVPAFAALLAVIGFQNFVTLPGLRSQADSPRLMAWTPLHGATRGGAATITADRKQGVALPIDVSPQPGAGPFASYSFELIDPQGKTAWTGSMAAPASGEGGSQRILLAVPGALLRNGAYTVAVSGVADNGGRTQLDRYSFNLAITQ